MIKGLLVNTKNANTFTGKQGKESLDIIAKNLSRILTLKESKSDKGTSETIKIKVPPGVEEGNYMTLSGQGNHDIEGRPGDLLVVFSEAEHEYFVRDGENILLELNISYPRAILGGKVDIPTVYGAAKLKIPSGIQSGQVLRMKGKGFPRLRSNSKGDQLVKIQVNTPSKINRKIKKYITELDSELDPIKVPFTKIKL